MLIGVRITVYMLEKLWREKLTYWYLVGIRSCKHNYTGQAIYSLSYLNIQESTFHYGASPIRGVDVCLLGVLCVVK